MPARVLLSHLTRAMRAASSCRLGSTATNCLKSSLIPFFAPPSTALTTLNRNCRGKLFSFGLLRWIGLRHGV